MKIALVNTRHFYGGGDSTYTFNLAGLLRSKGQQVSFFAMQDPRNLPDENADLFVDYIDFKELNRSKSLANGLYVLSRSIYSSDARRKFAAFLDRVRPDLVHLQNIHGHITPSVILEAKKRGIPVVWTLHDYKMVCPNTHYRIDASGQICEACGKGHFYQAITQRCKKGSLLASAVASLEAYVHRCLGIQDRVDAFLSPSAFLRDKLIAGGLPAQKVHHLPLFLPDEQFHLSGADQGYILFFGKLDPIKGIFHLIEAARQAPGAHLVLAGRADEALLAELPALLPANVDYVGVKHGQELADLVENARVVVLPSIWYENQPFSILESFARGKAVIASDLGGMSELVGQDERGVLTPPGDSTRLGRAMETLLSDPQVCRAKGEQAYLYARKYHSVEAHYDFLSALYESLS